MLLSPSSKLRIADFIQNAFKSHMLPRKFGRKITYADVHVHINRLAFLFFSYDEKVIPTEPTDTKLLITDFSHQL